MSLPWSSAVRLRLLPDRVEGRSTRAWRRGVHAAVFRHGADTSTPALAAPSPAVPPQNDLPEKAVEAVLTKLSENGLLSGATLDVELDHALVQFDVVHGDFSGDSDRQLQSIAVACMAELLGDSAADHEVRCQLQPGGGHLVISAISTELLGMLSNAAALHGLSLRSVQPDFFVQWNRHGLGLRSGQAVFAVAEGREAVVACVSDGAIVEFSRGGWLDQPSTPDPADPLVRGDGTSSAFGLNGQAAAKRLDARVDRLLASTGRVAGQQSAYLLVAPALAAGATARRWTVVQSEGDTR